jgi:hypothetical protein
MYLLADLRFRTPGACPSNLLLRAEMLSLRAECSKNGLCGVALLRLRAVFLRSRSRFGLPALATDITRTASWGSYFAGAGPPRAASASSLCRASSTIGERSRSQSRQRSMNAL